MKDGIFTIIELLGGLGLFLYGMKLMGDGLENSAGDKLKKILEKVTSNPFMAVTVGAIVTAVVQSSSAELNGSRVCKCWTYEFSSSSRSYYGCKYRNNYNSSACSI